MIINNNFISIVFLGNFNPAIISEDFLKDNNIFITDEKKIGESSTPVSKSIEFEKIKIIIDLNRFQVVEEKIEDFLKNRVINLAFNYIETLKYTPIRVVGINFNFNVKIREIDSFIDFVKEKQIFKVLNSNSFIIDTKKEVNIKKDKFLSGGLSINISKDKVVQISMNKDDNIFKVNYNYEVRDLDKIYKNRLYIKNNFPEIFKQYKELIERMFGDS